MRHRSAALLIAMTDTEDDSLPQIQSISSCGQPGVTESLAAQARGDSSALAAVDEALDVIARHDADIRAWQSLDAEAARELARQRDAERAAGRELGALHGVPIGVKDIIDTATHITANGTSLDADRQPEQDAVLVNRLCTAGAIVLGKTVTTELAFLKSSVTRNPAAPERTPGGSSSGSAAAVAAGMVPAAIGTQTGGSVIRPASYCGVVGYKPSFGAIPRTGVLTQSPSLDTVGVFTRSVEDAARVAEVMCGPDEGDPLSLASPPEGLVDALKADAPPPRLAFMRTPYWDAADEDYRRNLCQWVETLGDIADERVMPPAWSKAASLRTLVNNVEMARWFAHYLKRDATALSDVVTLAMKDGRLEKAVDYLDAIDHQGLLREASDLLFNDVDALICPAATGAAPLGLASTGDSIFNGLWTYTGVPAITLPLMSSADGAPMGVQLLGRVGDDARLLAAAHWLELNSDPPASRDS